MIQDAHAEPAVGHITNRSNTPVFAADRLAHALHEADVAVFRARLSHALQRQFRHFIPV
jgi:hypothetical protein